MKTLNEKSKFKWHYGYVIIIGLIFFQALTCGLTANLNGLFFTPVMEEFGCTRAQASFYLTIFFISAAVFEPVAGWTINKFDNRWLFPVIDLIYCAGYIWTAYAKSLVVFNIFGVIYGFTAAHFIYLGGPVIVGRWFKKGSATAYSIIQVAVSLFQMAGSPIIQSIISNQGWRQARLAGGLFCLVISVPMVWICIRHDPSKKRVKAVGEEEAAAEAAMNVQEVKPVEGVPFAKAVKNPAFYFNCVLVASLATAAVVMNYISSYGSSSSIGATTAALGISVLSAAAIGFKFLWGLLSDLIGSVKVLIFSSIAGIIGLFLVLQSGSGETAKVGLFYLACVLFAMSYSSLGVLAPTVTKDAWGMKDYSRIYSICTTCLFIMNAVGNYIYAALSDNGGFTGVFGFAMALYAVVAILAPVITKMAKKDWEAA